MKRAAYIQTELNELGAKMLMSMPSTMPYSLPINYFGTLSDEIIDVVRIGKMTEIQPNWGNKMPFEAPDPAYFEGLSAQMLAKVNTVEEWNSSNPFTLPKGYFETLPEAILTKVKTDVPKATKRVPLFRTIRLAASMALIFFTGFAVLKMNNGPATKTVTAISASDDDIKNYVNENLDDFDTDLIINSLAANNTNVNAEIDISDAEIKAYLDETGWN